MIWSLAAVPFIASTVYLWSVRMSLLDKLNSIGAAVDSLKADNAAKAAKIAELEAASSDEVAENTVADEILVKLGG